MVCILRKYYCFFLLQNRKYVNSTIFPEVLDFTEAN